MGYKGFVPNPILHNFNMVGEEDGAVTPVRKVSNDEEEFYSL